MFRRFFDEGLAQSSYLIACERTRDAAIVDPRRDVDAYVRAAEEHGLRISHAIETHTHADFVSGARELASLGATIVAGPGADLQCPFHEASNNEPVAIGDIALRVLHTPGHTPEHISILVEEPGNPRRVLTGDTLFVGAVGRPDLVGVDHTRALAESLYDSLFGTLLQLDDDVEVHPGHGAGSLCGAGIGKEPHSLIGKERRFNPLLQRQSRAEFVTAVLDDLPETPPYFARMKRINRAGPMVLGLSKGVPVARALAPRDAIAMVHDGALAIDLRSPEAFAAGHPRGALNVGFGARVGYWAGWLFPPGARVVLLANRPSDVEEVVRQLLRVGVEDVAGFIDGGFDAWRGAGGDVATLQRITARDLRDRILRRESQTLVDVRTPHEWESGHIEGSINIPLGDLPQRAADLRGPDVVATICESGYRSALAASLLLRAGLDVVNVGDGTAAYRMLESQRT
jgi:hydroxyacylglutathione hydrolase